MSINSFYELLKYSVDSMDYYSYWGQTMGCKENRCPWVQMFKEQIRKIYQEDSWGQCQVHPN